MSRHNISQAADVFQGKATYPPYQADKLGVEFTPLYRWKPVRNYSTTATGSIAAGAANCTLSGNFPGPTGFYPVTFSDGSSLQAFVTSGATTCVFYASANPLTGGAIPTATVLNAVTSALVFANVPPVLGVSNTIAASQTVTGAGTAFVINGASATAGLATLDIARNVIAAWTNTAIVTVTGTDLYGAVQTEVSGSGTSFTGKKAFATITKVTTSATITGATVGTGNVLGLPFRIKSGDVLQAMFNDAVDAGTFVVPDLTLPATATTGDVRGTYTNTSSTGANRLVIRQTPQAYNIGSTTGLFGVTQA